jgi:7-carboxy-7-deazaguanine synthase
MNKELQNTAFNISEIFYSIQGEGTRAGLPCVFVRFQRCKLRCRWCDTPYALKFKGEGISLSAKEIIEKIEKFHCNLIQITGGEPLHQENTIPFMKELCNLKYSVMLETGGSEDISEIDKRVVKIMDLKCPGSKMLKFNNYENIKYLNKKDEIKFVIADKNDFDWAVDTVNKYRLTEKVSAVLFSPVFQSLKPEKLAAWILKSNLPLRLQLQIHKYIWDPNKRGV